MEIMETFEINLEWNERYNTGVKLIDDKHKQLFSVVHRLKEIIDRNNQESSMHACHEMIKYFKSYTVKHFEEEEAYMRSIDYKNYEHHKELHDNLKDIALPSLEKELEDTNYSFESVQHFLGVCLGWLTGHIMTEDRKITRDTSQDLLECTHTEGVQLLEEVINQMINEMFDLQPKLLDHHYATSQSNIKLGETVNYELTYTTEMERKLQIVLAIEEDLVLKTVGSMADIEFYEVDEVVLSATVELARILMQRIRLMFKQLGSHYEFKSDRLVSAKEAKKLFKKNPPEYTMLFETEFGYFVFCIESM